MDRSDFIFFGLFGVIWVYQYLVQIFFPPDQARIFGMFGIALWIGSIFFIDIYLRERYNPFPHIRMIICPEKETKHLYLDKESRSTRVEENEYSSRLKLAFPVKIPPFGKVKTVILNHLGRAAERLSFDPGMASAQGFVFNHPQSETIVVTRHQVSLDHAEPAPAFYLRWASKDTANPPLSKTGNPSYKVASLQKQVRELQENLVMKEALAKRWQEEAEASGDIMEQQRTETRALLKAKGGVVSLAVELLLTILKAVGTIEGAIKELRGSRFTFQKWMIAPLVIIATLLFLHFNPQVLPSVGAYFTTPANWLFIIGIIAVILILMYSLGRRR